MKKTIFILLLFFSLLFADSPDAPAWLPTAILAGFTSIIILALIYMAGQGFNLEDMKFLAKEELYQVVVTFILIVSLQGSLTFLDVVSGSIYPGQTLHQAALSSVSDEIDNQNAIFDNLYSFSVQAGKESSRSFFCSLHGLGYSVSPCSSYRALISPVSMAFQAISLSLTELSSLKTLLLFSQKYGFAVLLPAGLLFRTLKFTRGAGGVLIGFAVAIYIFLPMGYLFMNELHSFSGNPYKDVSRASLTSLPSDFSCDSTDYSFANLNNANGLYDIFSGNSLFYLYLFLVRGTLTTVISVLVMVVGMKFISKIAGAEVDVSILSRIG